MRRRCTKREFVVGEIFMGDAEVQLPTDSRQQEVEATAGEQDTVGEQASKL